MNTNKWLAGDAQGKTVRLDIYVTSYRYETLATLNYKYEKKYLGILDKVQDIIFNDLSQKKDIL